MGGQWHVWPASTWFKLQGRAISTWYLVRAWESYALVVISKSTFPIPRDGFSEHNIIPPVLLDENPASLLRERPYEAQEPGPSDFNPHMELSGILVAFCLLSRSNFFHATDVGTYQLSKVQKTCPWSHAVGTVTEELLLSHLWGPLNWVFRLIRCRVQGNRQPQGPANGWRYVSQWPMPCLWCKEWGT